MKTKIIFRIALIAVTIAIFTSCSTDKKEKLTVAVSPYQDLAMIVNVTNLELEKKYDTKVDLRTMNYEDILPSIVSSGKTIDIGFNSYNEFLTKENNINQNTKDPLLFLYPAYIFKGGVFITFDPDVPEINSSNINDSAIVRKFLSFKIGAQKNSLYEMMLYSLARKNNINIKDLKIFDTSLNDGILAAQNGSLQIACAGLTQLTEAKKNNGRIVLSMDNFGFADVTGFVCLKSTYDKKKREIDNFIKMWFDCVNYVMADIDNNSKFSLSYLDQKAATKYSLEQYKTALSQEYFPKTIDELEKEIINDTGKYSYKKISNEVIAYLMENNIVSIKPEIPQFPKIK